MSLESENFTGEIRHYNLDKLRELACGDEVFMHTLVGIFLDNTPGDCAMMVKATEEFNWNEVGRQAHKLKSTINSLDIKVLKEIIRDIELNAKSGAGLEDLNRKAVYTEKIIHETADQLRKDFKID